MMTAKKFRELVLWLGFSVILALSPVYANYLSIRDNPSSANQHRLTWSDTYDGGELMVIAAVLCADAVGKLFKQAKKGLPVTFCLFFAVFILMTSSMEFGMVARGLRATPRVSLNQDQRDDSLWQWVGSVWVGIAAIMI